MSEDKMSQLQKLSNDVWMWFKEKDKTSVDKRDDLFWEGVTSDIAKKVRDCSYKDLKKTYTDLLNAYAGQLQKDYTTYLLTKQETLKL